MSGAFYPHRHPAPFVGGAKHLWLVRNRAQVLRELEEHGLYQVAGWYNCKPQTLLDLALRYGLTDLRLQ